VLLALIIFISIRWRAQQASYGCYRRLYQISISI